MKFEIVSSITGEKVKRLGQSPIFLRISLYTSENPPAEILLNKSGNKIFKGQTVREIENGVCNFRKLQIKEVSSHFRNGWIFLVVSPVDQYDLGMTNIETESLMSKKSDICRSIRPFVLDNLIIKAKLGKKKKKLCC